VNPGYVSRAKRVCAEAPDLAEGVAAGPITLREAEREIDHRNRQRDRDAAPRTTLGNGIEIRLGAFQEVLADIEDGSVALIVADLLWQDEHVGQWDDLGKDGSRLFMPGGILVAYCGWGCLLRAGEFLSRHLTYGWGGALPHRGPNKRVHSVKCIEGTTPMLFYAKGDFRPKEYWRNAVESPRPEKDWHPYQKPLAHVAYYIEKFTNPGDLVVDPSLGGSTTAVACQQGKRRFIGCDIEPDAVAATLQRLHDDSATAS
jgi:site-specific DNA-methyltransferase (adenine-specific)